MLYVMCWFFVIFLVMVCMLVVRWFLLMWIDLVVVGVVFVLLVVIFVYDYEYVIVVVVDGV